MKLGVIGGSGLEKMDSIGKGRTSVITTPYGTVKLNIILLSGQEIVLASRHGEEHQTPPSQVNIRAIISALKAEGVGHIIATTVVGSLKEEIKRGDFVVLDQFLDFTKSRKSTFYDKFEGEPVHAPLGDPFSGFLRGKLAESCQELGIRYHKKGCVVTIEGPRFSTRAESKMYKMLGGDVINMTVAQEAILAKEIGLEYAAIAMVTDYDSWKEDEAPVSWPQIKEMFSQNIGNMVKIVTGAVRMIADKENVVENSIRTIPDFPKKGIMFRDITTLLKDTKAMGKVMEALCGRYKDKDITLIAGIESRGFVFGSILADRLNVGFVLVRKKGKLPAPTYSQEYDLEYGKDQIEVHKDAIGKEDKFLIIDDLIATGGTASAFVKILQRLGVSIVEAAFVVELEDLKGRENLESQGVEVFSLVKYKGE